MTTEGVALELGIHKECSLKGKAWSPVCDNRQGGREIGMHSLGVASMCLSQEGLIRGLVRKEASGPAPSHLYTLLWKEL